MRANRLCCLLVVGMPAAADLRAAPLGTAFTYQGRLVKDGTPVTDTCAFTFGLLDDAVGGAHQGTSPLNLPGVAVADGLFKVDLDFGNNAINGEARWLEIFVQCTGDNNPIVLLPRVPLHPVPYALALPGMRTPQTAMTPNVIGGTSFNSASTGVVGATIAGGGFHGLVPDEGGGQVLVADEHFVFDNFGMVGGGSNNMVGTNDGMDFDQFGTVSGGYGNSAAGFASAVGGGYGNIAYQDTCTVAGGQQNTAVGNTSIVSGGYLSNANGDFSTVGGGRQNNANGYAAIISGGTMNTADDTYSTVAGGAFNTCGGNYATIGGGGNNITGTEGATVAGGYINVANNDYSTVGGGKFNTASGEYSTVPGGWDNQAGGNYSFAAGYGAKVRDAATVGFGDLDGDQSTFVWSSGGPDFISTGPYQFLIRATGGVGINTNTPATVLHLVGGTDASLTTHGYMVVGSTAGGNIVIDDNEIIARTNGAISTLTLQNNGGNVVISGAALNSQVGINRFSMSHPLHVGTNSTNGNGAHVTAGGVWTNGSDRDTKQDFVDVDSRDVLDRVASLPVQKWRYTSEPDSVRHIGPTAQDFYAAFGVGHDDRYIPTIDADGVALAAIQGLHQIVQEKDCEITELKVQNLELDRRNQELERRHAAMEARLAALEARIGR